MLTEIKTIAGGQKSPTDGSTLNNLAILETSLNQSCKLICFSPSVLSRSPSRCSGPEFVSPPPSICPSGQSMSATDGMLRMRQQTFGSPGVSLDGPAGAGEAGLQGPSNSSSRRQSTVGNLLPQILARSTVLEASRKAFLHVSLSIFRAA